MILFMLCVLAVAFLTAESCEKASDAPSCTWEEAEAKVDLWSNVIRSQVAAKIDAKEKAGIPRTECELTLRAVLADRGF